VNRQHLCRVSPSVASRPAGRGRARAVKRRWNRRGVASVLAMMFLVMFSALSVAMAVASQGNLRTADTHQHLTRAMSAAETGLGFGEQRLFAAIARFQVDKGVVDAAFARRLWAGSTVSGDGRVNVLPSRSGMSDSVTVRGVADALLSSHLADQNIIQLSGFPATAGIFDPSGTVDASVFRADTWVRTGLLPIDTDAAQDGSRGAAFQITYAPLANGTDIRIIVTGYSSMGAAGSGYRYGSTSGDATARSVSRIIQQDYRIAKRPSHAVTSPTRIMIGKNVNVHGDLGTTFTDVTRPNGDPIQTKGDFDGLNASLDAKLARFRTALRTFDVNGDNRLRVGHPTESQGLPGSAELTSRSWPANAFSDITRDGHVDEFDIFINHYDADRDGILVLSSRLTAGTPAAGRTAEFAADDDLAFLIDNSDPDRNRNGTSGYTDTLDDGRVGATSSVRDADDVALGWRDGVISWRDNYAKVKGRLTFRTTSAAWATARGGSYAPLLQGPFAPPGGKNALRFNAGVDELPLLDESLFAAAQTPLTSAASGLSFDQQVAAQLGISSGALPTYTEASTDSSRPRFWRGNLANAYVVARTGRALWEKMPFNSPAASDWYLRPRYENMTFRNVQIPAGNNGLFINCRFIGVTYVRSYTDNRHANWSLYGQMEWSTSAARPVLKTAPLDKSDFLRYTSGNVADGPSNYAAFPDPPVINGAARTGAARDTKLYSNNIRFHDCTVVGSVVAETPATFTNIRNKLQFTGATRFSSRDMSSSNPADNPDASAQPEIDKSPLMAPNYSVDIGSFNAPTDLNGSRGQNVQLKGSVVAGVLDMRGTARLEGALFLTFNPVFGQGPLSQNGTGIGNPANFNTTLGYFGDSDGDGESLDPSTLPIVGGVPIVGFDTDGDGIADVNAGQPQPAGSVAVPFNGFGRVEIYWNPDLPMPDGILLPLSAVSRPSTYREGKQ